MITTTVVMPSHMTLNDKNYYKKNRGGFNTWFTPCENQAKSWHTACKFRSGSHGELHWMASYSIDRLNVVEKKYAVILVAKFTLQGTTEFSQNPYVNVVDFHFYWLCGFIFDLPCKCVLVLQLYKSYRYKNVTIAFYFT